MEPLARRLRGPEPKVGSAAAAAAFAPERAPRRARRAQRAGAARPQGFGFSVLGIQGLGQSFVSFVEAFWG